MLKFSKPVTPSQRQRVSLNNKNLAKKPSYPFLIKKNSKSFGRNNQGKKTVRYRGGGHKRLYRKISFIRENISGVVENIEYDPNRSANIAAIKTQKGFAYILASEGLKRDDKIYSGVNVKLQHGNALPLSQIPLGSLLHNISIKSNQQPQLVRSAGTSAQLIQKHNKKGMIRLPSGEIKNVDLNSYATLGVVSNLNHKNINLGKAGRNRWLNRRPHVRGVAKNPVDHPHGGGEGKTSGGRPSVSFTGKLTKGLPTVKNKKNYRILSKK